MLVDAFVADPHRSHADDLYGAEFLGEEGVNDRPDRCIDALTRAGNLPAMHAAAMGVHRAIALSIGIAAQLATDRAGCPTDTFADRPRTKLS